jgi:hypothetical protein
VHRGNRHFLLVMILSATPLSASERRTSRFSIKLLERRGFINEAYLLRDLATFRSNDNWLNASVSKENAFAATNYPFAIITLYPDFLSTPETKLNVLQYCYTRLAI